MATFKYFSGEIELTAVYFEGRKQFGRPVDFTPVWDAAAKKWNRNCLPVTRTVRYKSNPSKHVCDARCMNATGRNMQCECSCGGKNHGVGAFNCEAA